MSPSLLTLIIFAALVILLMTGLPIVFVLGGLGAILTIILTGWNGLSIVAYQALNQMDNFVTVAIPLFIFIGILVERAGIAEAAFDVMYKSLGRLKGGLAVGSTIVCTLFAAMTGTAAASTIAMGTIALPQMLKHGYDKKLSMGSIAASGTLGVLIPPSVLMVLFGLFSQDSIGQLFAGGIFAGLVMSAVFIAYILIRSYIQKDYCPALPAEERASFKEILRASVGVIPPIIIIVLMLGSILAGIATPTEAAGVGCVATLVCAIGRRTLTWKKFFDVLTSTLRLSAMVVWIIFGSSAFAAVFSSTGAIQVVTSLISSLPVSPYIVLVGMLAVLFILGMFVDPGAIIMLTVPIFVPITRAFGFNSTWFGVLFVVLMQTGYITPPFGFNLFYMRQIVPQETATMQEIYKAVIPFILLMLVTTAILVAFPAIITWLPSILVKMA